MAQRHAIVQIVEAELVYRQRILSIERGALGQLGNQVAAKNGVFAADLVIHLGGAQVFILIGNETVVCPPSGNGSGKRLENIERRLVE